MAATVERPARVEVDLASGRTLRAEMGALAAGVDESSTDAVVAKFRQCFHLYDEKLAADRGAEIIDTVLGLDGHALDRLFGLLH